MSALYDYQLEGLGGYQEFDRYPGEETVYVDCPTCRGKGRINMSSEKNQLISLGEDLADRSYDYHGDEPMGQIIPRAPIGSGIV